MTSSATADHRAHPSIFLAIGAVMFAAAAVIGAYLDWRWWPAYDGIVITIAAGAILLLGVIAWVVGRLSGSRVVRRAGLATLVVGVGLVIGQTIGPSREPLLMTGGTMTLRLESPVSATGTSTVICTGGASETEFAVSGDPNMRLDTPDQPFISVSIERGDRWAAIHDTPRKDGVRLEIAGTAALVPDTGKPASVGMEATPASTVEATFSNRGGSIRFADLAPEGGPDFSGASTDFAGTVDWTCGGPIP